MQIQSNFIKSFLPFVVICFKFSNFAYANTVQFIFLAYKGWLLFALNLVTLLMQIQSFLYLIVNQSVVICFKFSNFAYANTVEKELPILAIPLLFALNLVTLLMQIQSCRQDLSLKVCCYLL